MTMMGQTMKHVVKSAALLQIAAIPLPPHDQSANEAEKVCNYMWRAARMYMIDSRAPHKLFADAVDYAIYVHNRTSSTESRDRKTPHEMAFGIVPTIEHIYPFYTKTVETLPKDIFQELVRKVEKSIRALTSSCCFACSVTVLKPKL